VTEDADVDERLEGISKNVNQGVDSVRDYYRKHNMLDGLREQLREEKTLKWLLLNAEAQKPAV